MSTISYSSPFAEMLFNLSEIVKQSMVTHPGKILDFAEASFYRIARPVPEKDLEIISLVRRFAVDHFSQCQFFFTALQTFSSLHLATRIVGLIHHPLVQMSSQFIGPFLPASFITIVGTSLAFYAIKKVSKNDTDHSNAQLLSGACDLNEMFQSLALIALGEEKFSHLFKIAFKGYSFYKNSQIQWLSVSSAYNRELPFLNHRFSKVEVFFNALLFPSNKNEECSVCMTEIANKVFCSEGHAFDKTCLKKIFHTNTSQFDQFENIKRYEIKKYHGGTYVGSSYSYELDLDEKHLPACPLCRQRPSHHKFQVKVHDQYGVSRVKVNVLRKEVSHQKDFEKLQAVYSLFQGVLGLIQCIPELTGSIAVLRRWMILSDLCFGVISHYCAASHLQDENKKFYSIPLALCLSALPPLLGLSHFFQPNIDLETLDLPNTFKATWDPPLMEKIHLGISTYRLITTFALTCFSKVPKVFSCVSLLGQLGALFGALQVPWLHLMQEGIPCRKVDYFFNASFYFATAKASLNNYVIFSKPLLKTEEVKNAILYVGALQNKIIKTSKVYIVSHFSNGVKSGESISLEYLMDKVDDLRRYLKEPFIWTLDGMKGSYSNLSLEVSLIY